MTSLSGLGVDLKRLGASSPGESSHALLGGHASPIGGGLFSICCVLRSILADLGGMPMYHRLANGGMCSSALQSMSDSTRVLCILPLRMLSTTVRIGPTSTTHEHGISSVIFSMARPPPMISGSRIHCFFRKRPWIQQRYILMRRCRLTINRRSTSRFSISNALPQSSSSCSFSKK
jgi:hypothetical protein